MTDFQTQALLHLEAADPGLPNPRVIPTLSGAADVPHDFGGKTCRVRLLSWAEGEALAGSNLSPGWQSRLGALVARMDLGFRGFSHPAQNRRLLWDLQEAASLRDFVADIPDAGHRALATRALEYFAEEVSPRLAGLRPQVIHNDLNPHNVVVDPADPTRIVGVIDFGDIVHAPLVQEVGTACAYLLTEEAEPLAGPAGFLAGYTQALPLTAEEIALIPGLIMTRMAMTLTITGFRSKLQPENATYILRNAPRAARGLSTLAGREMDEMVAFLAAACRSADA